MEKEFPLSVVEEKLKDFIEKKNSTLFNGPKAIKIPNCLVPHSILEEYQQKAKDSSTHSVLLTMDDYYFTQSFFNCVPAKFWKENAFNTGCLDKHFYYHYNGEFYKVGYKERPNVKLWDLTWLKEKPDVPDNEIVDFSDYKQVFDMFDQLSVTLSKAASLLYNYSSDLEYHPEKYRKIVEVEKIVPDKDLYDPELSITRKDSEKVNKWMKAHMEKFHPKGPGYQGAISVSNFELRKGWTGIGPWCDMVCTVCLEKAEKLHGKKAEKLKEDATFNIEKLG